jgi:hypothetical protein
VKSNRGTARGERDLFRNGNSFGKAEQAE